MKKMADAALDLKEVFRAGWMKAGIEEGESVAEHTYGMSVMAMVLSDMEGLNTERVLKMALLHDIAESVTGDITPESGDNMPGQIPREEKIKFEQDAMDGILSELPERLHDEYQELWKEYVKAETPEAILVHDADKMDMLMEANRYKKDANPDELNKIIRYGESKISPKRAKILSEM